MGLKLTRDFNIYGPEIILDRLEDRIVLDAAVDPQPQDNPDSTGGDPAAQDQDGGQGADSTGDAGGDYTDPANPDQQVFEQDLSVVLISNALDEIDALTAAAVDDAHVIVYDAQSDDLASINAQLDQLVDTTGQQIGQIAILSHGDPGVLELSALEVLDAQAVESAPEAWSHLGTLLSDSARIDLYGCELGQGENGLALVSAISELTGATVWASDDDTGSYRDLDWDLEVHTADSDRGALIDPAELGNALIFLDNRDVDNAGFESGSVGPDWNLDRGSAQLIHADSEYYGGYWTGNTPYASDSDYIIRLDTSGSDGQYSQISQTFTLTDRDYLEFAYNFMSNDTGYNDTMGYNITGSASGFIDGLVMDGRQLSVQFGGGTTGWQVVRIDLSDYVGEDITVEFFAGDTNTSYATWGYFDMPVHDGNVTPFTSGIDDVLEYLGTTTTDINLWSAFDDNETPDSSLVYTVESVSNPGLFDSTTIDPSTGTLTLHWTDGAIGVSDVTVRATDAGGRFIETDFMATMLVPEGNTDMVNPGFDYIADPLYGWTIQQNTATPIDATGELHGSPTEPLSQYTVPPSPFGSDGHMIRLDQWNMDNPAGRISQTWTYDDDPYIVFAYNWITEDAEANYDDFGYSIQVNGVTRLSQDLDSSDIGFVTGPPVVATGWQVVVFDATPYLTNPTNTITLTLWAGNSGDEQYPSWGYVDLYFRNDPPTSQSLPDITVFEDAPDSVIDLYASFEDDKSADEDMYYTVIGNTDPSLISTSIVNGQLTLDYLTDQSGEADITVQVMDEYGKHVEETFHVTVLPVNDLPEANSQTVSADEAAPTVITITGYDADAPDVSEVSFTIVDDVDHGTLVPVAGSLTHDGNGNYSMQYIYTPTSGYEGSDSFDFVLNTPQPGHYTDGAGTDIGSPSSGYTRYVEQGDIDGDGDLDYIAGVKDGMNQIYINDGTGVFTQFGTFGTTSTRAVALADMDGDGWLDVVEANQGVNRWYQNLGESSGVWLGFGSGSNLGTDSQYSYTIDVADVNRDGWLDIVSGGQGGSVIYYSQGVDETGTLNFDAAVEIDPTIPGSLYTYGLKLADVNNDGWVDLVTGNADGSSGDAANSVYLNDGTGAFVSTAISFGSGVTRSIDVADVNNDGFMDVVIGNGDEGAGQTNQVFINQGNTWIWWNGFDAGANIGSDAESTYGIQFADVNHDGWYDVVAGNRGDGHTGEPNRIYFNDGTGGFDAGASGTPIGSDTDATYSVTVGDFNGDDWVDIIAGNRYVPDKIYLNTPEVDTSAPATVTINILDEYDLPEANSDFMWVARNSDWVDFVVYGYSPEGYAASYVDIEVYGDGPEHGDWQWADDPTYLANGYYVRTFQYRPDSGYWGSDSFQFTFSTPSGVWLGFVADDGEPIGASSDTYNTYDVALADLGNDGIVDLIVANATNSVRDGQQDFYYFNDASAEGGFADGLALGDSDTQSRAVATGDLNNDGYTDVVIHTYSDDIVYLWDPSTSSFAAGVALYNSGSQYGDVAVGDIDNDGWLDIVVASGDNSGDRLYMNNGDGTFDGGRDINSGDNTRAIAIADMNGDGYMDIVRGIYNGRDIIQYGYGNGYFTNGTELSYTGYTNDLDVGDVDGDGDMDFVVANQVGGGYWGWYRARNVLYLNNGDGSFSTIYIGNDYLDTNSINLADIDNDGDLDVFVADEGGQHNKYYLYNSSTRSFAAGVDIGGTVFQTYGSAAGDVDGDGDVDFIAGLGSLDGDNGQNRLYRNLGYETGYGFTRQSGPATISIHVGVFDNWSYEADYSAWNLYEEPGPIPFTHTFGIVTNNTHVGAYSAIDDFYPDKDNPVPQLQFGFIGDGVDIVDLSADDTDMIAVQFTNGPSHSYIWQDISVPYDSQVTDLTLTWRMAYWNYYPDGWEADNQYLAVYVYDAGDPRPDDPVWKTDGDDPLIVDHLTDFVVKLDTAILGDTVRVELETNAGFFFINSAIDNFRLIPTRPGAPPVFPLGIDDGIVASASYSPAGGSFQVDGSSSVLSVGTSDPAPLNTTGSGDTYSLTGVLSLSAEEEQDTLQGMLLSSGSEPVSLNQSQDAPLPDGSGSSSQGGSSSDSTDGGSGSDPAAQSGASGAGAGTGNLLVAMGLTDDTAPSPDNPGPTVDSVDAQPPDTGLSHDLSEPNMALVFDPDDIALSHVLDASLYPDRGPAAKSVGESLTEAVNSRGSLALDMDLIRMTDLVA